MMRVLPTAGETFEWADQACGPVLRCAPLGAVADHFFTTRHLTLERPETNGDGWRRVAAAMAVAPGAVKRVRQVHGAAVACFRKGRAPAEAMPAADIVMTDDPGLAVAVQVADCVPLLVADARTGVVAAAHAGWRGAAAGVAAMTVEALGREFGARPDDLVAAVGPAIGPCCYEVGEEVRESFRRAGFSGDQMDRWFVGGARGRPHLDLWRATADQLMAAGIPPDRVHACGLCTATHRQSFYSYRADGPGTGRMVGVIRMR